MKTLKKMFESFIGFFKPNEVILETDRLILRPWKTSDAKDLYRFASDKRVGPSAGWQPHKSVEDSKYVIQTTFNAPYTFAIVPKELGFPVGAIGITLGKNSNFPISSSEGEIGYWLGVPYWNKGYASEATREIIRYGFEDLNLLKLWCGYFEENTRSKNVQEKCGFKFDRIRKDVLWTTINEYKTECITKLSREEWFEKREELYGKAQQNGKAQKEVKEGGEAF